MFKFTVKIIQIVLLDGASAKYSKKQTPYIDLEQKMKNKHKQRHIWHVQEFQIWSWKTTPMPNYEYLTKISIFSPPWK